MFLKDQKKENCCGCLACSQICPVSAIRMQPDEHGFAYPKVDQKICIDCGLCRKICPMQKTNVGKDADPKIYAVRNKDEGVLSKSSSGGMFSLLAGWILDRGGVVYGVAFGDDFSVRHERAESMEAAGRFRTSKYVESDPSAVYRDIRKDLLEGRPVLLTGTPCQIDGVTGFLKAKHTDMDLLYTCDNICHGVPSRMVWNDYIHMIKSKYVAPDDEISAVNMRSKNVSWKEQKFEIELKKGNIDDTVQSISFNQLFLSLMANRPSCFSCHYTSYSRVADFTLGDFWNAESADIGFDVENGINEVLANTPKAEKLMEQLRDTVCIQPITKEQAWQPYLEYSAQRPSGYEKFWNEYLAAEDKEPVIRKYVKGSFVTRVIHILSPLLRRTGLYNLAGKLYRVVFVRKEKK